MKGKSVFFSFLMMLAAYIVAFKSYATPEIQAWLGVGSVAIAGILGTFFSNGVWTKGWKIGTLVIAASGVIIQILNAVADAHLGNPTTITIIVLAINITINFMFKGYDGQTSIAEEPAPQ